MAGNSSVPCLRHLVEAVHAGGGLLADAADARRDALPLARRLAAAGGAAASRMTPHSSGSFVGVERRARCRRARTRAPCARAAWRRRRRRRSGRGRRAVRPHQRLVGAPPVLLERLALPGEDGGAARVLARCRARPTATAAAAVSCVLKMLHDTQRTSAPRSTSVSISTAVCTVMCSEPMIRAPASGLLPAWRARSAIRPGISCSARRISLRPSSASARSFTLKGRRAAAATALAGWLIEILLLEIRSSGCRNISLTLARESMPNWAC